MNTIPESQYDESSNQQHTALFALEIALGDSNEFTVALPQRSARTGAMLILSQSNAICISGVLGSLFFRREKKLFVNALILLSLLSRA